MKTVAVLSLLLASSFLAESRSPAGEAAPPAKTLDDAFNEAIYYYACLKVDKAFEIMDEGIKILPPTSRSHGQMLFYKWCFNLAFGNPWAYDSHSAGASKFIEELKKIPDKSDTDLVRLALLIPTGGNYLCDRATAQELVKRYPSSPWAAWARWQLVWHSVIDVGHERLGLLIEGFANELERELKRSPDEPSIMRSHLARETCSLNRQFLQRMKERYALIAKMTKTPDAAMQQTLDDACKPWSDLLKSLVDEVEGAQRRVADGNGNLALLWDYYELLRKSGVKLPDCIPADKETFMKETVTIDRFKIERRLIRHEE